jgi:hypothetical protein
MVRLPAQECPFYLVKKACLYSCLLELIAILIKYCPLFGVLKIMLFNFGKYFTVIILLSDKVFADKMVVWREGESIYIFLIDIKKCMFGQSNCFNQLTVASAGRRFIFSEVELPFQKTQPSSRPLLN